MRCDQLEHVIRAACQISGRAEVIVMGSQAILGSLDESVIIGIEVAASIHDVGKLAIPAEILSRPGRLTDVEFGLIRQHAQAGADIVAGIDFPWPVRKMILEHHERLDGSGYPQGLRDGEIILGARVIAVADTVEAMLSHRPYRPGLGLAAALDEIGQNRGTLYDLPAVDACQCLFKGNGFSFEGPPS